MSINKRIFNTMEDKNLKIKDLADVLGINQSVVSTWKKRGNSPSSDYIVQICDFLDVSIEYLITGKETSSTPNTTYSSDDVEILNAISSLNKKQKSIIVGKLYEYEEQNLKEQSTTTKQHLNILPIETTGKEYIELTVYNQKASAGIGKYMLDDVDYEEQEFELNYRTSKADHAIIIEGNSMYPTIEDKQYVFVKEQAKIEHGEIGIFVYEDNVYCKRLCIDKKNKHIILISDNDEYDDITIENIDELRTIGKVIL